MPTPDPLAEAAEVVGGYLDTDGRPKAAFANSYGFAWQTLLITILRQALTTILAECQLQPEAMVRQARGRSPLAVKLVHRKAKQAVSERYSLIGRVLYRRQINELADKVADATIKAGADADPDRIEAVQVAARAAKGVRP